jgi:hypothetical protein
MNENIGCSLVLIIDSNALAARLPKHLVEINNLPRLVGIG